MNGTFDFYHSFVNNTQSQPFPHILTPYANFPQYSYSPSTYANTNFYLFYPEILYNFMTNSYYSQTNVTPVSTQSQKETTVSVEETKQICTVEKEKKDKTPVLMLGRKKKRSTKLCTACPHKFAVHYAKNMCSNCYHAKGRSKRPWNCLHVSKAHYALGLCQNCYQMNYIKKQSEQETKSVSKGSTNSMKVQTLSSDTSVTTEKHIN